MSNDICCEDTTFKLVNNDGKQVSKEAIGIPRREEFDVSMLHFACFVPTPYEISSFVVQSSMPSLI